MSLQIADTGLFCKILTVDDSDCWEWFQLALTFPLHVQAVDSPAAPAFFFFRLLCKHQTGDRQAEKKCAVEKLLHALKKSPNSWHCCIRKHRAMLRKWEKWNVFMRQQNLWWRSPGGCAIQISPCSFSMGHEQMQRTVRLQLKQNWTKLW